MSASGFGRLLAALPTPLDERGALDVPALDHLVHYFAERDLEGLVVGTEAGEGPYLDAPELQALVQGAARGLAGKKPFWVQIGHASTREAADAAAEAAERGAEGVLLAYDRRPGVGYPELYRHVDRVGRAMSKRLLLVARPGDLLTALAPEEQTALTKHPRLSGVFVADGAHAAHLRLWAKRFEGRGEVFAASAFEVEEAAKGGCTGFICALSLLAPGPARAVIDAYARGGLDVVRTLVKRMEPAAERLGPPRFHEGRRGVERLAERIAGGALDGGRLRPWAPPGLLKSGLQLQGHRLTAFVRPPQPQLTDADRDKLKVLLKASGMLG